MVQKKKIVAFLDSYLSIQTIPDSSANGLQVDGKNEIEKIGLAVDACLEIFNKAKDEGCDMIIVHHGLFWDKIGPITGALYDRIKFLMDNEISLYGAHAPIDKHVKIGNNTELLKMVGLRPKHEFGYDHDVFWGYMDYYEEPKLLDTIISQLPKAWKEPLILKFGKDEITSVAVVSGGAAFAIPEAVEKGIDLLIIGEMKHGFYHNVKEGKLNLIVAGHYNTETLGVKALSQIIEQELAIPTIFLDAPTRL